METLFLPEPRLTFRHDQAMEDPRDGLMLFGPLDAASPYGIRAAVVGTERGVQYYTHWVRRIAGPLADAKPGPGHPVYPGFEPVFRIPWAPKPVLALEVRQEDLQRTAFLDDQHQRVYETVNLYASRIITALREEDVAVDIWFCVVPDFVYQNCRPRSQVTPGVVVHAPRRLNPRLARGLRRWPSLFEEENVAAVAYQFDVDFHNQLKARLLEHKAATQVVRESTIAPPEILPHIAAPMLARDLAARQAAIVWNLTSAVFYKAGGRPWRIAGVRDGVCYIGLVFKQDEKEEDPRAACCAAQMFLDSGDGLVFRGAVGPWYTPAKSEFHLSRRAAAELAGMAIDAYRARVGSAPTEVFLHGKVFFNDEEWRGFQDAVDPSRTNLVGIRIRDETDFKLYRLGSHPVLRGLGFIRHSRSAFLWTRGYTPRLKTYPGLEVPRPLRIDIVRGDADLRTVLADIMALTKLNYNACIFADGLPVTLRFADAVGEILTAGPVGTDNPLPFKYYI